MFFLPKSRSENHCSLICNKIVFKAHDRLYVFIHVKKGRGGGRQGEDGRAQRSVGGGPWTGPRITLALWFRAYTLRSFPAHPEDVCVC